jgi:hypothetical protein
MSEAHYIDDIRILKDKVAKLEDLVRNSEYIRMMKKKEQSEEKIFGNNKPK